MTIYVIVNHETLKIYIGQHKGANLQKYLQTKFSNAKRNSGARSRLFASMKKYPKDCWTVHALVSGIETQSELDTLEQHYIKVLKTQHPEVGYNILKGGHFGKPFRGPHCETTKKNTGAHFRELWGQPAYRERMRIIHKNSSNSGRFKPGQKPSPLSGAKEPNRTSFIKGNLPWNIGTRGVKLPNSGSFKPGCQINKGRVFSQAHRDALSRAHMKKETFYPIL